MSAPMLSVSHQWKGKYSLTQTTCRIAVVALLDCLVIIRHSRPDLASEIILLENRIQLLQRTKYFDFVRSTSPTLLLHMNCPSFVIIVF